VSSPSLLLLRDSLTSSDQDQQKRNNTTTSNPAVVPSDPVAVPLYRSEGIFAVHKPINWTSQDAVSYIRGMLERDARDRGADPVKATSRRNKSRIVKVGHGGTLDPLATGVLVIGVGKGTKQLSGYLSGSKGYRATGMLGIETSTLDLDPTANITKEAPWDHVVSKEQLQKVLPKFTGKIQQVPPIFSAKRINGKKAYEAAREGIAVEIEAKEVEIHQLDVVSVDLPHFTIDMECGGGTFVRSLIRDIAYDLDTVATTTELLRTKQGPFLLKDCLPKDDWSADNIYACIDEWNTKLSDESNNTTS
jgi:tRNA pseudouridine55 synthase